MESHGGDLAQSQAALRAMADTLGLRLGVGR
jgi:hypothetical protein